MVEFDFVCPKKWDSMQKKGGCLAHCATCAKDVVDVSEMSDDQVQELIALNDGDVCISIQSERVAMSSPRIWFRRTVAAVILLAMPILGQAQQVDPSRTVILPNGNEACEKGGSVKDEKNVRDQVVVTEEPKERRRIRRRRKYRVVGRTIGTPSF